MQKSERLKTEFMNIAAHELKSPVTPIKGYLDLIISDEESNEKIKKWAQVSLRNADRLLLLVNDILDVSRLDNDTMKFEMRKIDPSELLMEMAEDMRAAIESKHLEFNVQIPSNLPPILGDYHRLHQVFKNLFVNALKFTDQGSITFKAENKQTQIVMSVEDTGIGIRQEDLQKIFEKFYQAETADNRKHEGTGLGLFICRQIIQKHKGDIAAKSTPTKGTTFYVALPTLEKRNPPENRSNEEEMSQM
jgi:signal transduction histidine kinase